MISAEERVHRKSVQSLQEFRDRLQHLSHTPEIETSSEGEETKTIVTMGDNDIDKALEATPVASGTPEKTGEQFERPDYSPILDKTQERPRTSSYEKPSFLDIVLGREHGKKKGQAATASPLSKEAGVTSPAQVRRISSTEPLAYPEKSGEKPVMAPVMVRDGAGAEFTAALKDSTADELREGLHRASMAFEDQEAEKEELGKRLEQQQAEQQEKEEALNEFIEGTSLMAQRAEQYDTLCEQLVPEGTAGPLKLGTFITQLIDVDTARIQEAEERALALQGKLEELTELTRKTLEVTTAKNAELLEQNKLMAEQLDVKESQIVRLTELVEKAASSLEKRASIAPVEDSTAVPSEARHEEMEERDPLLRMLQKLVQSQKRMIDSHERRIQRLGEEIDAEKRISVDS